MPIFIHSDLYKLFPHYSNQRLHPTHVFTTQSEYQIDPVLELMFGQNELNGCETVGGTSHKCQRVKFLPTQRVCLFWQIECALCRSRPTRNFRPITCASKFVTISQNLSYRHGSCTIPLFCNSTFPILINVSYVCDSGAKPCALCGPEPFVSHFSLAIVNCPKETITVGQMFFRIVVGIKN